MPGVSQEAFLARVRSALARHGLPGRESQAGRPCHTEPVELPDDLEVARVAWADDDVVALFAKRVDQSAMKAHRVADEPAMIDKVVELATGGGARSAIVPADELPARDRILAALREKDIELRDVNDRDAAFAADVGITGADSAVAETGSVYIVTGAGRRPLASLAVTCHIIVVHVSRIVPDLLDWAARQSGDMPANGVFITGPSKTSDIEMILVQGVHGPGEVHVVIVG